MQEILLSVYTHSILIYMCVRTRARACVYNIYIC